MISSSFWTYTNSNINLSYFNYQKYFIDQLVKNLIGLINHDLENPGDRILSKYYNQSKNYYLEKRLTNFEIILKNLDLSKHINNSLISCYFAYSLILFLFFSITFEIIRIVYYRFSENYKFHKYIDVIER
ncbi:hypothetical protein [Spiroplasma alleghenense]|uniref:hypothetical protein n=1 Tax=Spiroplasma alleghenense TaxID=216931 RepID=UPI000E1EB356|nr:hypothetical protein [Spiroplasma alleghenense]